MTELVTHSPIAALIPMGREKGESVKRMIEDDDREGCLRGKTFVVC